MLILSLATLLPDPKLLHEGELKVYYGCAFSFLGSLWGGKLNGLRVQALRPGCLG